MKNNKYIIFLISSLVLLSCHSFQKYKNRRTVVDSIIIENNVFLSTVNHTFTVKDSVITIEAKNTSFPKQVIQDQSLIDSIYDYIYTFHVKRKSERLSMNPDLIIYDFEAPIELFISGYKQGNSIFNDSVFVFTSGYKPKVLNFCFMMNRLSDEYRDFVMDHMDTNLARKPKMFNSSAEDEEIDRDCSGTTEVLNLKKIKQRYRCNFQFWRTIHQ